jgi:glutathione S-transferase
MHAIFSQLFPIITTGTHGDKKYLEKLEDAFSILDAFLEGKNWVAGKNITIADYSIIASVSSIEVRQLKFV